MNKELRGLQHRLPNKLHFLDRDFNILTLPKQLDDEKIDNFIELFELNILIVDDAFCLKRLNKFRSIAEKLHNHVKQNGNLEDAFELDVFFDVREFAEENILEQWNLQEFIDFFCRKVSLILTTRQFEGKYNQWVEHYKRTSNYKYDQDSPSLKQQFRTNKQNWMK